MLLFCPTCQATFPGVTRCPRCGGLLLMPHEVAPDDKRRAAGSYELVRPTLLSRVVVGIVLAMAFYLAARKLAIGTVLAVEQDPNGWWLSSAGVIADHSLQAVAVLFGTVIAGAGQTKGATTGSIVGAICGALFLGYQLIAGADSQNLSIYLQLPVLGVLGLIGGLIAATIWTAPPKLLLGMPGGNKLSSLQLSEVAEANRGRPTVWARVLIGTTLMVVSVTAAEDVRLFVQKYSLGIFHASRAEGEFITWQIALLAGLAGAMVSGATTGAGARHGFFTGVLAGLGVYGLCAQRGVAHLFPAVRFWLDKLSIPMESLSAPATVTAIIGSIILLGIVGGWMGGALFMHLSPGHRMGRRHGFD